MPSWFANSMDALNPHSVGTLDEPIIWKRCAFSFGSFQPAVTMVFHRRSCTSGRTYKYPEPLGAISHLCGLEVYISQPRSCRFSGIMPVTCAPSKADRMPFERARAAI